MKNLNITHKRRNFRNRIRVNILYCLLIVLTISTAVTGINAQEKQDISENELFLLKSLRVVDSMAQKAERFNAEGEMKKAKFFAEYFQRNSSISKSEITNLNQIARELTRDEAAIALEQNGLLNFRKFTKEEFDQLTAEEINSVMLERKRKISEHSKALQALKAKRTEFRKNYLNRINQTISPNTLVELQNFVKSVATIRRLDSNTTPGGNLLASLNFIPTFLEPFATLSGGGSSVEVWGISDIFYDESNQEVNAMSETWGFCKEYESGGGGGGGGGPIPFVDVSYRFLQGSGYSVPCDLISVDAKLYNHNNILVDFDYDDLPNAWDDVVTVFLSSSATADGNYCITGLHKAKYGSLNPQVNTTKCVQVESQPEISKLEFQVNGGPIDDHPAINNLNSSNAGKRIYADKSNPNSPVEANKVRINVTVTPATSGVTIHFKNFDLDDPSTDLTLVDIDGSDPNDNKGLVNGNRAGQLSATTATTNSAGVAYVDLTVSKNPGDNYKVVVGKTAASVSGLTVSGINVQKGGSNIPIYKASSPPPPTSPTNPAMSTELLTVWRRLHIEVDSMGVVSENKVEGIFPFPQTIIANGNTTLTVNPDSTMRPNRFENGSLAVGNRRFSVIDSTATTNANGNNFVVVTNSGAALNVTTGQNFTLYDDDNWNDSVGDLNGDDGEDIATPDLGLLEDSDSVCTNVYNVDNCNILAVAYVRPKYDIITGSGDNVPFDLNLTDAEMDVITANNTYFDNIATEANEDFWTIYLLGAYQYEDDGDPDEADATYGVSDSPTVVGRGSTILMELNRPTEYNDLNSYTLVPVWTSRPVGNRFTTAHEVGHIFGGDHDDNVQGNAGIMRQSWNRTQSIYSLVTLNIIRGGTNIKHP